MDAYITIKDNLNGARQLIGIIKGVCYGASIESILQAFVTDEPIEVQEHQEVQVDLYDTGKVKTLKWNPKA